MTPNLKYNCKKYGNTWLPSLTDKKFSIKNILLTEWISGGKKI
jgi:hypothetical protein